MADNFILETLGFKTSQSAHKDESPQLQAIDARLDADKERQNKEGLLTRGINGLLQTVWHSDLDSQKKLEELRQQVVQAESHSDVEAIKKLDSQIAGAVKADEQATAANGFRDGVSSFVTDTAITSTYFVRGSRGRTAATVLTGLNDIHPEDGTLGMARDGLLGATRGYVLARTFDALGQTKMSAANKGVVIGLSGRLEDGLLNAQTYKDQNGQFSLRTGLESTAASVANPLAIVADAATFGMAHGAGKVVDWRFAGILSKNPMAANVFTGFTIGTLSGANAEIQNESKTGHYSALDIVEKSLLGGASNASSAALGARLEQTPAFAPGRSVLRPGTPPEGSIMLPQGGNTAESEVAPPRSHEVTGATADLTAPRETAAAGDLTATAAGSHTGGQEDPIPPISKMRHLEPETPGSLPVELFQYKPEVKVDDRVIARYPDYDSIEKAGYTWFDNAHMKGANGEEIFFYVRPDSPDVFAVVPEANGFSIRKADGYTAVSTAEFNRQSKNLEQLRQWHEQPALDDSKTEQKANGRTEYLNANLSFESKQLDESAGRTFSGGRLERFNKLRADFEEEALRRNLNSDSIALLYKQLNRLLSDAPNAPLSIEQRRDIAEQILNHSAHPETVEQDHNNVCTAATLEKRNYYRTPDKNAQVLADLALTGKTVTVTGEVVDLNQIPHALKPDTSAKASMQVQNDASKNIIKDDPSRDFASQLLQTAIVNDYWRLNTAFVMEGQLITYNNFAFDQNNNLIGIMRDPSKVKPANEAVPGSVRVFNGDGQPLGLIASADITPLYDQSGQRPTRLDNTSTYYDQNKNPIWTATKPGDIRYQREPGPDGDSERMKYRRPDGNWQTLRNGRGQYLQDPQIRTDWLTALSNDFTNANEEPFVISSWARPGVLGAASPEQLAAQLDYLRSRQQMPAIPIVNMDHPLFNRGRSYDGALHVVMIHDFLHGLNEHDTNNIDPAQMRVLFSNQWGTESSYLNPGVQLPYFFRSMLFNY